MSENPNIERAENAIAIACDTAHLYDDRGRGEIVRTLSSAGLLVTPLHERALEACEALAKYYTHDFRIADYRPFGAACKVGRESLALKEKAKVAKEDDYGVQVLSTGTALVMLHTAPVGSRVVYSGTESQARRVAAALNEGDES